MSLRLVKVKKDDLQVIAKWRMLPEVTKYMYTNPTLDIKTQERWFISINNDNSVRYWLIEVDGIKIGVINLYNIDSINRRVSWAYYIGNTSFRGRGIARLLECNVYDYVFYTLGLNKLCCEVLTFNKKVIDIHKRFGTEVEGVLKQHIYKDKSFYDVAVMAITKDKWDNIKLSHNYEKIYIE